MTRPCILTIDQGTTSSRAIAFDADGKSIATTQAEFRQLFPQPGWVEHDPEEIWSTTVKVGRALLDRVEADGWHVLGMGIANQRETTIVWERASGRAVYNAIVWQDRRTADRCETLRKRGLDAQVGARTGLLLDPYFSATKIAWILDHVDDGRARARRGELLFGTVDCYLLWRLTGGRVHATDATNASRTMLFNIHDQQWDDELLRWLDIPAAILPTIEDCAHDFGNSDPDILGRALPICAMAGDQQAAAIGQACFEPGMLKSTYGTGCFALLNTGDKPIQSRNRLLATVAYRLGGQPRFALEGSIFVAGAAVQWLRDGLHVIGAAGETERLARSLKDNHGVYLVPAFTGLGAPWWDPLARGAIFGLVRDTGIAHLARAALESVCYQTHDLLRAMAADAGADPVALRVDGGMAANDWMLQMLADVCKVPVERPDTVETTALGVAFLAGLQLGMFTSLDDVATRWHRDAVFSPALDDVTRARMLRGWHAAVARTRSGRADA